jgi:hypothetical protein
MGRSPPSAVPTEMLGWALIRLHCAPDLHTIDDVSEKWISTRASIVTAPAAY